MNINKMMKQVQDMQKQMEEFQEKIAQTEFVGTSGGGMVQATLLGNGTMSKISIDKEAADDLEMMEDLIVAAVNDARAKVDTATSSGMSDMTSGLKLPPGMNLPF